MSPRISIRLLAAQSDQRGQALVRLGGEQADRDPRAHGLGLISSMQTPIAVKACSLDERRPQDAKGAARPGRPLSFPLALCFDGPLLVELDLLPDGAGAAHAQLRLADDRARHERRRRAVPGFFLLGFAVVAAV